MQTSYPKEKLSKIKVAAAKAILPYMTSAEIDDDSEIIAQLKEKFFKCFYAYSSQSDFVRWR